MTSIDLEYYLLFVVARFDYLLGRTYVSYMVGMAFTRQIVGRNL